MPVTRYGPHRDDDQPTHVVVLRRARHGGKTLVPIAPSILRQRAQVNDLAHHGYVMPDHRGRVPDPPFCMICGRDEDGCLAVRFGDDDHPFEASGASA